jgi:hypothetical protein
MEQMDNIYSVLITACTVLGSAAAFRFYEKKSMRKERDEEFIRHDCRDRIAKLEALLVQSSKEKDEMRKMRENDKLEKSLPKAKRQLNG